MDTSLIIISVIFGCVFGLFAIGFVVMIISLIKEKRHNEKVKQGHWFYGIGLMETAVIMDVGWWITWDF